MFKSGNTLAADVEIPMSRIEFKRWRQFNGWTKSQAAKQLGLDLESVDQFETVGKIPEYIENIVRHQNG